MKREPHRAGSEYIHARLRPGDILETAAPRGTFLLSSETRSVLLISAGVGATPVLAMLHALAASGSDRDIWWLHGARSRSDEPFAAESRSLVEALPHGHRHICFSHPAPADVRGRDYQTAGRLSSSVLSALGLPLDADTYICGPGAFMVEVSAAVVGLGLDATRIRTEIFGTAPSITPGIAPAPARPPHQPEGARGQGSLVGFARSGLTPSAGSSTGSGS